MKKCHTRLTGIQLAGFKSIREQSIRFGDVTLLLGANGSGKSNLASFFTLMSRVSGGAFQSYIARHGGANSLLYFGAKKTSQIRFSMAFGMAGDEHWRYRYSADLTFGMPDRLVFEKERIDGEKLGPGTPEMRHHLVSGGGAEAGVIEEDSELSCLITKALSGIKTYQFHDTSDNSKVRANCYTHDNETLREDAGNLAAFLYGLKGNRELDKYYRRIVRHVQNSMPQFHDFQLKPDARNENTIRLNWFDITQEFLFGPHQISDGSLRFMALASLLLQPPHRLPRVIVLDEPELGLHPAAISELAGMIRTASVHSQVIVATQSTRLVDEFELGETVVVDWDQERRCSEFKRLEGDGLNHWLERYSLSELWEKNVFGGRP